MSPQRHIGTGAIEDDSGTDNEIKRRISMSIPRLLRSPCVFVVTPLFNLRPNPFGMSPNGLFPEGGRNLRDVKDEPSRKLQVVGLSADRIEDATWAGWRLGKTESRNTHDVVSKISPQTK